MQLKPTSTVIPLRSAVSQDDCEGISPRSDMNNNLDALDGTLAFFTIGHSTRSIPEFTELLRAGAVELVVDVRRMPRSRTNPQYNEDVLGDALAPYQVKYMRIAELGGLRKKSGVPLEVNSFWENRSFRNYADYALGPEFRDGLDRLLEVSNIKRTAIMCAEAVWWRCHRRIIADYLIRAGRAIYHLMGVDQVQPAAMTPAALPAEDGIRYPR